jgi:inorganic pyrophosphatase
VEINLSTNIAPVKDQIEHFFTYYKDLDEGKWVKIDGWGNAEEAKQELLESFISKKIKHTFCPS